MVYPTLSIDLDIIEANARTIVGLCAEHGIPTAAYGRFTDADAAKAYLRTQGAPIVVKADGLTAGKGVTVAETLAEAEAAVDAALLDRAFGTAGAEVVIEECLVGEEASVFALVDGTTVLALASAQDHKQAGDGDTGPNTGGMGAYSPAPIMTEALAQRAMDEILAPTVHAMREEAKTAIRQIRRDSNEAIKKVEKGHEVSEDDARRWLDEIQKKTDGSTKEVDQLCANKETELSEI